MRDLSLLSILALFTFFIGALVIHTLSQPYTNSDYITGVTWDWSSKKTLAPGSDNWPITWADDGNQYTCYGDGGGFGGTNSNCRASLGFARVSGSWDNYSTKNVWGCNTASSWCGGTSYPSCAAENPATFGGKSYGVISVKGAIYCWWGHDGSNTGSAGFTRRTLPIKSTDYCANWTKAGWYWTDSDNLYGPSFLNYGQDNAYARDEYVYSYFPRGSSWGLHPSADLARVHQDSIMVKSAYSWFAGVDGSSNATWTKTLTARQPVFEDANGIRTISCTYVPGLNRYILTNQHTTVGTGSGTNKWGIFEGKEPWGPWKTVDYYTNWQGGNGNISFYIAPKWISADGRDFTLVYTADDNWGTIRGRFTVQLQDSTVPSAPSNLNAQAISDHQIQLTWNAASDPETGISKYRIYRDGQLIGTTDSTSYTDGNLQESTLYAYQVSALNGADMEGAKTASASATTQADVTAPTLVSVTASGGPGEVKVVFSEPVEAASASSTANYAIDNGITVSQAVLDADGKTIRLSTNDHTEGMSYTLTVNNIRDLAKSPNTIATDSKATYQFVGELQITNITAGSGATYTVATMESPYATKEIYVDRSYTVDTIDPIVDGTQYLLTANDDKSSTGNAFLSFDINLDVVVYIGVAGGSALSWMSGQGWQNTGKEVAGSHSAAYTLFQKDYAAGTVTLGGNEGSGANMYMVFIGKKPDDPVIEEGKNGKGPRMGSINVNPNPFKASVKITVNGKSKRNKIKIYNINGVQVADLSESVYRLPSTVTVKWNASHLPTGLYCIRAQVGHHRLVKWATLIK
jgi:hypothetical protein